MKMGKQEWELPLSPGYSILGAPGADSWVRRKAKRVSLQELDLALVSEEGFIRGNASNVEHMRTAYYCN